MEPIRDVPDPKNHEAFKIVRTVVGRNQLNRPYIIGITGAGGAGKTTFGINIMSYYGTDNCVSIDLDDYLIPRELRGKLGLTGYNPRANKLSLARQNISDLIAKKPVFKPRYDHTNGQVIDHEQIASRPLIVIEGVTTLYDELADLCDVSFFLDALEETQIQSRVQRDVNKRGYSLEQALILFESLKPEYERFIEPTKRRASVVFMVGTDYVMVPTYIDPKLA